MTTDIARQVAAHFGPEGLRRIEPTELQALALSPESAEQLVRLGLPVQVGPYFVATSGEPLALGEYAATIGFPDVEQDKAQWCRLGTDHGAEICVGPAGTVEAVFVKADERPMRVNSSVTAFVSSLLALDTHLPVIASPGDQDPVAVFRRLRQRLLDLDDASLQDAEAWWPRVLEEIRHALSFRFSAAFKVEDDRGGSRIETEQAQVGLPHPERVLWSRLSAQGVRPAQVTRIYTELEPCFLPGNYCAMWLTQFTNAEFTHSFDYGATAEEREAGMVALMKHAASRR
ncbi:nucleic acid/nucleotide deaminase domain-containing protein [Actinomadura sp. 6N118]|uniref:nucleic acid/nucleotide deaminase domain-containing protein n=1 Tax=Actinomadura sp. 6N118 TaxID=3375151 RepID=UPI0037A9F0B0